MLLTLIANIEYAAGRIIPTVGPGGGYHRPAIRRIEPTPKKKYHDLDMIAVFKKFLEVKK